MTICLLVSVLSTEKECAPCLSSASFGIITLHLSLFSLYKVNILVNYTLTKMLTVLTDLVQIQTDSWSDMNQQLSKLSKI